MEKVLPGRMAIVALLVKNFLTVAGSGKQLRKPFVLVRHEISKVLLLIVSLLDLVLGACVWLVVVIEFTAICLAPAWLGWAKWGMKREEIGKFLDDFEPYRASYGSMNVVDREKGLDNFDYLGGVPRYLLRATKLDEGKARAKAAVDLDHVHPKRLRFCQEAT
ncbi:hypothetical protein SELMODRAFT_411108 [Selaginella moellendorffii]|uniref:Uncharacterized protein n=1 Tax=Selaginella moellendorffii TaxID=88036 RepID=D8RGL5_SELML|nr:hypothetical protein SELMODRAFT_411108 [Selaginella moellendorffii]